MTLAEYQERGGASVMRSARPHHVLVSVRDGDVTKALRQLKKQVDECGLRRLLRPDGRIHEYQPPSVRRRNKRRAAVARVRKVARRERYDELRAL
jgi:ribosomal protein S21